MRGDKLLKALEIIEKTSINLVNFVAAFSGSKFESAKKLSNFRMTDSAPVTAEIGAYLKERRKAQYYISFLKREGFVAVKDEKVGLTQRGYLKLKFLKSNSADKLPVGNYSATKSSNIVLFAFDIPEKRRKIRDWLRVVLKRIGFNMIQQSVWIGKVNIPEDFLNDLRQLQILENVEILAVTKSGSLNRLS
ncbi:MAG: CRISPR-associated endonuclease Cas2 [Patescibacteria group bacterium]